MPAQYAPAPSTTNRSPRSTSPIARSAISSASSGPGVIRSPLSQQCPTTTYFSVPSGSFPVAADTVTSGCCAAYSDGRNTSVIPASSFKKTCPPSLAAPVVTLSCTVHTIAQLFASRNVPGSISSLNSLPVSFANASKSALTGAPTTARSVLFSYAIRPTLYPPPRFSVSTVGNSRHRSKLIPDVFCHTAGSLPLPMCVWMRTTLSPCFSQMALASGRSSCQIPNELDGPPTFVFPVPPLPRPGLNRRPISAPGNAAPNASSCDKLHAFTLSPFFTSSSKNSGNSCVLSEQSAWSNPARTARRTSCPLLASIFSPAFRKIFRIAAFGDAFIA
mmetsp:Transcript_12612/g.45357  ORF Transcript_12612/g.45357 Transcript_12612/m.45357 type:complete len:332 (-) Transcript_12612:436-1431(-)